jgi:PAS domain S-box-containing protein
VIGSKVLDRVHPDSLPNVVNRIRGVLTEGLHAPPLDEKLIRFDGSVIDAEVTSSPVFLDGRPAAQLVLIDISERKQAQEALRRSEQRLLSTLENTPNVAIQWYDENGKILYWNRASESFYGYQSSEALGKTLDQLIHTPEEAAEFLQILQSIRETGKPYGPYEAHIHRHDGSAGWVLATVFEIPGGEGNSVFVCMDADIPSRNARRKNFVCHNKIGKEYFKG